MVTKPRPPLIVVIILLIGVFLLLGFFYYKEYKINPQNNTTSTLTFKHTYVVTKDGCKEENILIPIIPLINPPAVSMLINGEKKLVVIFANVSAQFCGEVQDFAVFYGNSNVVELRVHPTYSIIEKTNH